MKPALLLLACLLVAPGCSGGDPEPAPVTADTSSRRQRDSVIGESRLPGARGVREALDASDAAAARTATFDSLSDGVNP